MKAKLQCVFIGIPFGIPSLYKSLQSNRLYTVLLLSIVIIGGCEDYRDHDEYPRYRDKMAVRLFLTDTGSSLLSTIAKTTPPKHEYRYIKGGLGNSWKIRNYIYTTVPYDGLEVYNTTSQAAYFIRVLGSTGISIPDSSHILVTSSIGKALFDITNPDSLKPLYFQFGYPGHAPVISDDIIIDVGVALDHNDREFEYLFEYPIEPNKIIYGWDAGALHGNAGKARKYIY